jgi:transposase
MKLYNVGADLSKKTIDFFIHQLKAFLKVDNSIAGFREMIKWFRQHSIDLSEVMIVMEHTGLYSYQLEQFLHQNGISFTKVSALAIKRSFGLVRGKSDKIDARRIARYAFEKQDCLGEDQPVGQNLTMLQRLHSTRERLVKTRASYITAVNEEREAYQLTKADIVIAAQLKVIKSLDQQIQKLEDEIQAIVQTDEEVNKNYGLLQSIKGVGPVVALATIIKTGNFTRFRNARKFACFCGTAPFEHTSGTSIRGKTKISSLRDKKMKTLLDLAAKAAIQYDKELHDYFMKRVATGKSTKSTRNIVRNKIIYRMFAVIKRQTPYQETYTAA